MLYKIMNLRYSIMIAFALSGLGACQTVPYADIPEMSDEEYAKVAHLPELVLTQEDVIQKRSYYSRKRYVKRKGKKLYGGWTRSTSSACIRSSGNAYILADNVVSKSTKYDPCPEDTPGHGEDIIKVRTED